MLKRLGFGLIIGVVLGGLLGYGLFQLIPSAMAGGLGYVFAAVTGVLVGLVAGKPIWAKGAAVEAGLKAGIGAALACGILFGIRFLGFSLPEIAGIPSKAIGYHAIGSLLAISTVLAVFYELDNSGDEEDKNAPTRKRVSVPPGGKKPAMKAATDDDELLEDEPAAKKAKK